MLVVIGQASAELTRYELVIALSITKSENKTKHRFYLTFQLLSSSETRINNIMSVCENITHHSGANSKCNVTIPLNSNPSICTAKWIYVACAVM